MIEISKYEEGLDERVVHFFESAHAADATLPRVNLSQWRGFVHSPANQHEPGLFVATTRGSVVGLCTSWLRPEEDRLRHFRILVHPDFRRRGIAGELLGCVEQLDQAGVTLQTLCPSAWRLAHEFYRLRGFRSVQAEVQMERASGSRVQAGIRLSAASIRRATVEDAQRISKLHDRAYRGTFGFRELGPADIELQISQLGNHFLQASHAGDLLGFIQFVDEGTGAWSLESLVVTEAARGSGVGASLISRMLELVPEHASVCLGVNDDNASAIRLYERFGFTEVSRTARLRRPPGAQG